MNDRKKDNGEREANGVKKAKEGEETGGILKFTASLVICRKEGGRGEEERG